jgi:hypothetical protein
VLAEGPEPVLCALCHAQRKSDLPLALLPTTRERKVREYSSFGSLCGLSARPHCELLGIIRPNLRGYAAQQVKASENGQSSSNIPCLNRVFHHADRDFREPCQAYLSSLPDLSARHVESRLEGGVRSLPSPHRASAYPGGFGSRGGSRTGQQALERNDLLRVQVSTPVEIAHFRRLKLHTGGRPARGVRPPAGWNGVGGPVLAELAVR